MTLPWIASAPSPVQPHSHDHCLRLNPAALHRLAFRHEHTVQDPSILQELAPGGLTGARSGTTAGIPAGITAGITEWTADTPAGRLSLGWDWVRLHDGSLQLLRHVPPRSNLRLTDERGYDLPPQQATERLWQLLQQLDWRGGVQAHLA